MAASIEAIERILAERGAVAEAHYMTAGVSGSRTAYRLPDGRRMFFKQIRPVRLPQTCAGCIQRLDLCLPLDESLTFRRDHGRRCPEVRVPDWRHLAGDRPSSSSRNRLHDAITRAQRLAQQLRLDLAAENPDAQERRPPDARAA